MFQTQFGDMPPAGPLRLGTVRRRHFQVLHQQAIPQARQVIGPPLPGVFDRLHLAATEAITLTTLRINRIFLESEPFFRPFGSFSTVSLKLFFKLPTSKTPFSSVKISSPAASIKNLKMQIVTTVGMTFFEKCDSINSRMKKENGQRQGRIE
ncbi:MAG: hypothetical protein ABSG59_24765 [Verrucomicrobiota bacterium]|jgi:hypothetical protein